MVTANVIVSTDDNKLVSVAREMADRMGLPFAVDSGVYGLALHLTPDRLELVQTGPDAPGPVYVDFVEGAMGHRRKHGGGRGQLVAKAVGIKKGFIPTVIDATAGLGRDAFVLAQLGCRIQMLERSAIVTELLRDGMQRALQNDEVAEIIRRMSLEVVDAKTYLVSIDASQRPDVVYVDPMHPERSKTAMVKKEMRIFRALVGCDEDDSALLQAALGAARKRVVVKRPRKAVTIEGPEPSLVYEGKSTRFDVYLV